MFSRVAMSSLRDLDVAVRVAKGEAGRVLARDHAGQRLALLGRDVPLPEARIDLAVRIDDVGQERGAAVRAHAVQRRPDFDLAERRRACGRSHRRR